jgi:hypothetical protein
MSPEQLEVLARAITEHGLQIIDWNAYLLMVVVVALSTAGSAWIGAFFSKRGEIKAVQRDLEEVLNQTRRITQVVEREKSMAWVEQERWRLKRDTYTALIPRLFRLQRLQTDAVHVLQSNNSVSPGLKAKIKEEVEAIMPVFQTARLFVSDATLDAYGKWIDRTLNARQIAERVAATEAMRESTARVLELLIESAKRDLILSRSDA